ncbi:MAG: hypothetical protein KAZ17_01730 [Sphingorhabdus sp.]|nr:hypothetical protein [Sphingorhabdus sp.]
MFKPLLLLLLSVSAPLEGPEADSVAEAGPDSGPDSGAAPDALAKPLTAHHMRQIGCIATLGLIAHEQRRGIAAALAYPNLQDSGQKFTGIVGDRITFETGQPREVIALAIRQSVADQQRRSVAIASEGGDPATFVRSLMDECLPMLSAEITAPAN